MNIVKVVADFIVDQMSRKRSKYWTEMRDVFGPHNIQ